ncbi:MAG: valine--tRNA ligase, partial [Solirubrobacteraceae bacterium]
EAIARAIEATQALRSWRDGAGVRAGATITARAELSGYEETQDHVARLARVRFDGGDPAVEPVATVAIPGGTVEILPGPELDLQDARERARRRREQIEAEIERAERKLANPGFVAKAPVDVVQAERDKLARLRAELESL